MVFVDFVIYLTFHQHIGRCDLKWVVFIVLRLICSLAFSNSVIPDWREDMKQHLDSYLVIFNVMLYCTTFQDQMCKPECGISLPPLTRNVFDNNEDN